MRLTKPTRTTSASTTTPSDDRERGAGDQRADHGRDGDDHDAADVEQQHRPPRRVPLEHDLLARMQVHGGTLSPAYPSATRTSVRLWTATGCRRAAGRGPVDRGDRARGRSRPQHGRLLGRQARLWLEHAAKHAARGGVAREELEPLVTAGFSARAIAERMDVSYPTVRHWLKKYGLKTRRAVRSLKTADRTVGRDCPSTAARRSGDESTATTAASVPCRGGVKRRRAVKRILIEEAGGACRLCGYDRVHRRAPVPSPRSEPKRSLSRSRVHDRSGRGASRGREVRAPLRELPCGG